MEYDHGRQQVSDLDKKADIFANSHMLDDEIRKKVRRYARAGLYISGKLRFFRQNVILFNTNGASSLLDTVSAIANAYPGVKDGLAVTVTDAQKEQNKDEVQD